MKKNKKAQGLSINTIVIAGLALLIMVVLIAIFYDRITATGSGIKDCRETHQGNCEDVESCDELDGGTYIHIPGTNCEEQGMKCCKEIIPGSDE